MIICSVMEQNQDSFAPAYQLGQEKTFIAFMIFNFHIYIYIYIWKLDARKSSQGRLNKD